LEFNRHYESVTEEILRQSLFKERLSKVQEHNKRTDMSWKKGINHLSDRTDEELKAIRGYNYNNRADKKKIQLEDLSARDKLSSSNGTNVDWRLKGVITAVKDQGACGSCWAFAAVETIESYYAIKTQKLFVLSEQQVIDCTPDAAGCGGGTFELAAARIIEMGGVSNETEYPYVSGETEQAYPCFTQHLIPAVVIDNYFDLPSNQLTPVLQHLTNVGPLGVAVSADSWQDYASGVFDGCNKVQINIDHDVQLVGYGTDPTYGDYWLVRNSWGLDWGEQGYIRVKRYDDPPCGNNPERICGNCGILFDTSYVTIKP
jgi:cathepsin L